MIFKIRDIIKAISKYAGGSGVDENCSEGETAAMELYREISEYLIDEDKDAKGSVAYICMLVENCCFTLDYRFETIVSYNIHGHRGEIFSRSFKYLDAGKGELDCCDCKGLENNGSNWATHRDLPYPMHLMAFSDRPENKECALINFQGVTNDGKEAFSGLNEQRTPGFTIPIIQHKSAENVPYFTGGDEFSSGKLSYIRAISKPVTNGYVYVYGYDPQSKKTYWLTTLAPNETSPELRRYKIAGIDPSCPAIIHAKVLLRYVDQYHLDDIALIQNRQAYKRMAQALNYLDSEKPSRDRKSVV